MPGPRDVLGLVALIAESGIPKIFAIASELYANKCSWIACFICWLTAGAKYRTFWAGTFFGSRLNRYLPNSTTSSATVFGLAMCSASLSRSCSEAAGATRLNAVFCKTSAVSLSRGGWPWRPGVRPRGRSFSGAVSTLSSMASFCGEMFSTKTPKAATVATGLLSVSKVPWISCPITCLAKSLTLCPRAVTMARISSGLAL